VATDVICDESTPSQCAVKRCAKCGSSKPASREFFSPLKLGKFGLHAWCKSCGAARRTEYRNKNPEKVKTSKRRSRAKHFDKVQLKQKAYWDANREKLLEQNRNRAALKGEEYNKARRLLLLDPVVADRKRAIAREWRQANRSKLREYAQRHWKKSSRHRLRTKFGNAITSSLRRNSKRAGWQAVLGYTIDDLKLHLERQFLAGMNWENYGQGWHIDHILPLAMFPFETINCPGFKACWALSNLRPLWADDNLRKNARRTLLI
jgi:hypothetical protein